jgi:hypothetical protein
MQATLFNTRLMATTQQMTAVRRAPMCDNSTPWCATSQEAIAAWKLSLALSK